MNQLRLVIGPVALIALALLALATIAGYVLVPAETLMPVHWGPSGEADAFWPRNSALLVPPVLVLLLGGLFVAILARGRGADGARSGLRAAFAGIALLMAGIQASVVGIALGYPIDMVRVIAFGLGVMFVFLGNILPKSQPNSYSGVRLRWTLSSQANWAATNRFTGTLMMLAGVLLAVASLFVAQPPVLLTITILVAIIPSLAGVIFSYRFARREDATRPL
ncbi:SdpI family protein [Devosia sp.]|uniref:SdpI family protein n=1 Tax=Devosia sp. TaxID=1871048 RepID=UPI001ACB0B0D|nr:SdpI family protein [Devosia sp.]MBN9334028.1 SdpI family protein [Devosia sp.]